MSSNKKTFGQKLWEFFKGNNRNPTTFEVVNCLKEGSIARARIRELYQKQLRIEKERETIEKLQNDLRLYKKHDPRYLKALNKIYKILNL